MFFYEYGTVLLSTMSLSQLCLCSQDMSSPMTAVTTQTSATTGDFPSGLMCWVNQVDPHILCILAFFLSTVRGWLSLEYQYQLFQEQGTLKSKGVRLLASSVHKMTISGPSPIHSGQNQI